MVQVANILMDFGKAPGNYPVRLGAPRELHEELDTVALWALGKLPAELAPRASVISAAAVLFVQRACFAPENTYYQVLGLSRESMTAETLRSRYRALIRLTHPDMGVAGLPANAAGIVNRAHSVLSDSAQRMRYDEQLAKNKHAELKVRITPIDTARIVHHSAWRERWQSLTARYPSMTHRGLALAAIGLAIITILTWVSTGTQDGKALIIAKGHGGSETTEPSARNGAPPIALANKMPVLSPPTGAASSSAKLSNLVPQVNSPRIRRADDEDSEEEAPPPSAMRIDSTARLAYTPAGLSTSADTASSSRQNSATSTATDPSPVPTISPPLTSLVPANVTAAQPPQMALGTGEQPSPNPIAAVPTQARNASSTQQPAATTRTSGSPLLPGQPIWGVDTAAAKTYLTEVLSTLDKPAAAQQTNTYLATMRVHGSLLRPALLLMRRYQDINVDQITWTDSQRSGVMNVQGAVVLIAKNTGGDDLRRVNYRLLAEFAGTRDGTVLTRLDLKEAD